MDAEDRAAAEVGSSPETMMVTLLGSRPRRLSASRVRMWMVPPKDWTPRVLPRRASAVVMPGCAMRSAAALFWVAPMNKVSPPLARAAMVKGRPVQIYSTSPLWSAACEIGAPRVGYGSTSRPNCWPMPRSPATHTEATAGVTPACATRTLVRAGGWAAAATAVGAPAVAAAAAGPLWAGADAAP